MPTAPSCFASSYAEARAAFIGLARQRSAALQSLPIAARGPDGGELAIDVAWIGPERPARAVVVSSGMHGAEGFYGSAVQRRLLSEQLDTLELPDDMALVVVHAINPFGFAHIRRVNESNVDLNRNFIAHPQGHLESPDYTALHDLLNPPDLEPSAEQARVEQLMAVAQEQGFDKLQQIVTGGQYVHPRGIQFGGTSQERSAEHVRALCRGRLRGVGKVAWLDLHTGLGDSGSLQMIFACNSDDPAMVRGRAMWGARAVSMREPGESVSSDLHGALGYGIEEELDDTTELTVAFAEVGTYDPIRVFLAFRADNWLHHHGVIDSEQGRAIKAELKETFCPADETWRGQALDAGAEVIAQAVTALSGE